jgi:putative mRNA 3-end processing factor
VPIEWQRGGLKLQGAALWFDARQRTPLAFVSHAHADHLARHEHVIATRETLALMTHRLGPLQATTEAPYRQPWQVGGLTLELFPAGHVLGAAQVRVTREDGHRVAYTGDLSVGPSLTAAPSEVVPCDTLVLESTFGHPRYRFPPREATYDAVAAWARAQLAAGVRPILLAYSLGKSQETIAQLTARGLRLCADPAIHAVTQLYVRLGVELHARCFDGTFEAGEVGLFPPFRARAPLAHLGPLQLAALTGWALEPWGARRAGADVAFPVSDHADFPSLVAYARATGAREVVTVHGLAEDLARGLRQAGLFARAVSERVQLALDL